MNLFHDYKFKWWELGIFKLALLSIGVLIGVYWFDFFSNLTVVLISVAIITTIYIIYVAQKQQK